MRALNSVHHTTYQHQRSNLELWNIQVTHEYDQARQPLLELTKFNTGGRLYNNPVSRTYYTSVPSGYESRVACDLAVSLRQRRS